jgi:ParE toxin of type II toxin-antitoxin system, parDE
MIHVRIAAEALEDLSEGYRFYERKEPGLGEYFYSHLRADIEGLKVTGGIHRIAHRNLHRLISKTFPWAVFYTQSQQVVTVVAVIDCRRDPKWIRKHLER